MIMARLVKKNRPKAYKAKDAPYAVGGNHGIILVNYPRPYPMTTQQRKVSDVAAKCNIKSGISKSALMTAMKDCVKREFHKSVQIRGGGGIHPSPPNWG